MTRRRPIGDLRITRTKLSPYGLRGAADVCSPPISGGRRVSVCITRAGAPGPKIRMPIDVCQFLRGAAAADRESFYAIHLDAGNRVLGIEEVAKGILTSVDTTARETFKSAILSNAAAIILAHNHPSGDKAFSDADFKITARLAAAGKLLGIAVRDHVLVTTQGCTAMRSEPEGAKIEFAGLHERKKKG